VAAASAREVRAFVFATFVEQARAPTVEEMMARFGLEREEVLHRLLELQAQHHLLLLPGTERILMANPFSNLATPFRVSTEERTYFANCAWDAVALHLVLGRKVRVASACHHCGAPIGFELDRGQLVPPAPGDLVVYLGTPVSRWYDDLVVTCSNTMVFFQSQGHLTSWKPTHPAAKGGVALDVPTVLQVVRPVSTGRAEPDYEMPSRQQLMAHWASLGLDGSFWTF
jgi:Alkylmercury lyase